MLPAQDELLSTRKLEILAEARKLFSRKGYEAASMRDLAEALGIKPASLYSHYDSKEEILWEIAQRCAREFHEAVLPAAAGPALPAERLDRMIRAHIEVVIRNQDASVIFFREWRHLHEPHRSEYAGSIAAYEEAFGSVLREGMAAGAFRPAPLRLSVHMLLASLNWVHRWYRPEGAMQVQDIQDSLSKLLLNGLRIP
jgi:AcrR family transcriptional regulator